MLVLVRVLRIVMVLVMFPVVPLGHGRSNGHTQQQDCSESYRQVLLHPLPFVIGFRGRACFSHTRKFDSVLWPLSGKSHERGFD